MLNLTIYKKVISFIKCNKDYQVYLTIQGIETKDMLTTNILMTDRIFLGNFKKKDFDTIYKLFQSSDHDIYIQEN